MSENERHLKQTRKRDTKLLSVTIAKPNEIIRHIGTSKDLVKLFVID